MNTAARKVIPPVRLERFVATAFSLLLTYYWLLLYAASPTEEVSRGSVLYWLYVGPIFLFVGLFVLPALKWGVSLPIRLLLLYAALVIAVALVRSDYPTVTSTALLTGVLIVISEFRIRAPAKLLNFLFVWSIVLSALTFMVGVNGYGIVPGYSYDEFLPWRISLFPVVPESAYFSALVLLLNLVVKDLPLRRMCLLLSIYFLVFSGLRSTLFAAGLVMSYLIAVRLSLLRTPSTKLVFMGLALLIFVGSLLMSQLLTLLPGIEAQFLNVYLFRLEEGIQSPEDVMRTVYRTWLWSEHFRIAEADPIFGIGTFDFSELADPDPGLPSVGTGSESFLTGLYARVGLPVLLLVVFVVLCICRGARLGHDLPLTTGLLAFVAMLAYGSVVVPYNFVFLVMMVLIVGLSPEVTRTSEVFAQPTRLGSARSSVGRLRVE